MSKMNLVFKMMFTALIFGMFIAGCNKENDPPFKIEGLTLENFPLLDGSTSTDPLARLIACKLLKYNYEWRKNLHTDGTWYLWTDFPADFVERHLKSSQTHNAFINLIDNRAEMILSARKMSEDERAHAAEAGINLIETPIALDAIIFIANPANQVTSLAHRQLQDIFLGRITNWTEVGGGDLPITPYIRNRNSGSQELMETLVLTEPIPEDFPDEQIIHMMSPLISAVQSDVSGIGYTVYYYKETIIRELAIDLRTFAINGVYPDKTTLASKNYPYTSEVYAVIRSDLDKSSMAYKLYELLQTTAGKKVISESGYVPN